MPGMIQPERRLTWSEDGSRLMKIECKSLFTGNWNTLEVQEQCAHAAITRQQWEAWQSGTYIQHPMPQLEADEREFLLTGATPEEWHASFADDDL